MTKIRIQALRSPMTMSPTSWDGLFGRIIRLPSALVSTLLTWQERAEQRRHLAELDSRLLKDMGLSRADVWRESSIPFWRQS